jgi:hypothetical protein
MRDKGILLLTVYVSMVSIIIGFAIADVMHRYASIGEALFGAERIQWEVLFTGFAAIFVAWKMYDIERGKAFSAIAAAIIASSGIHNKLRGMIRLRSFTDDDFKEAIPSIEVAVNETRRAISLANTRAEARSVINLFSSLLNIQAQFAKLSRKGEEKVSESEVERLREIHLELTGFLNEIRESHFAQ